MHSSPTEVELYSTHQNPSWQLNNVRKYLPPEYHSPDTILLVHRVFNSMNLNIHLMKQKICNAKCYFQVFPIVESCSVQLIFFLVKCMKYKSEIESNIKKGMHSLFSTHANLKSKNINKFIQYLLLPKSKFFKYIIY